jgi:glycosyltransferase involved in cell wall biosynthesis
MRILTLNYEYPPLGGGGGVAAANLAHELARQGHDVDYVTSHFRDLEPKEVLGGVHVFREKVWGRKDLHTATLISMLSYPAAAIRRGMRLARSKPYDIVHTHFAIPTGPAGCALSKWLRLPHILSVYGGDIYDPSKPSSPHANPLLRRIVRFVLDNVDLIVPESSDIARRMADIYQPSTGTEIVPLGFVHPDFEKSSRRELGLRDETIYAIAVGRLIARKGFPDLLRAFRIAELPGLELLIIGDGPEGPALKKQAVHLGITETVHFLGHQDEPRKFQFLSAADFFVLASLHEGFGIVYQEAMHCGLPVVTTNVGGQVDFLKHGENALLSPPQKPEALADNLRMLAGDVALRERLSGANRSAVQTHLVENVARRYLELYEREIAGS